MTNISLKHIFKTYLLTTQVFHNKGAMPIYTFYRGENMNEKIVYKVNEVATMIGKQPSSIREQIRKGNIKAIKSGNEYLIEKSEINRYLGIDNINRSSDKDLEIEKLKGKIKILENQIQAFKSVAISLNNIIGI